MRLDRSLLPPTCSGGAEITPLVHQQGVYLTEGGQLTDHLSGEAADRLNEFFFAQYYREHKVVPEGAG